MSDANEAANGTWAAAKRILDTALATAQNRLELFAVELEEEKIRLVEILVLAAAAAIFGLMALTLVTFTIVVLFWDSGRMFALGGLCLLYVVAGAWTWRVLQARLKARSAFADTISELRKDRECLHTKP